MNELFTLDRQSMQRHWPCTLEWDCSVWQCLLVHCHIKFSFSYSKLMLKLPTLLYQGVHSSFANIPCFSSKQMHFYYWKCCHEERFQKYLIERLASNIPKKYSLRIIWRTFKKNMLNILQSSHSYKPNKPLSPLVVFSTTNCLHLLFCFVAPTVFSIWDFSQCSDYWICQWFSCK